MRIVTVTALWKRHDVARIFWAGLMRVRTLWESYGHEVRAVAVGTDDDEHRRLALAAGAVYLDYPENDWLGGKLNAGFGVAQTQRADYAIKLDSDDLLGDSCARAYAVAFQQEVPYVGLEGCYFYNLRTGKVKWWAGYDLAERGRNPRRQGGEQFLDQSPCWPLSRRQACSSPCSSS